MSAAIGGRVGAERRTLRIPVQCAHPDEYTGDDWHCRIAIEQDYAWLTERYSLQFEKTLRADGFEPCTRLVLVPVQGQGPVKFHLQMEGIAMDGNPLDAA